MTASVTIYNCIPYGDAREHNGASGVQFLRIGTPENPRGLSPFSRSSACLYRRTHNSTPCDMFANSLDSTFFSRYSMISGGRDTVIYGFRFAMQEEFLQKVINTDMADSYSVRQNLTGVPNNERIDSASASHAGPGRHRVSGHGMPREPRGSGPRRRVGEPPALPLAGADEGPEGGNRPLPAADLPHALWHCGGEAIA